MVPEAAGDEDVAAGRAGDADITGELELGDGVGSLVHPASSSTPIAHATWRRPVPGRHRIIADTIVADPIVGPMICLQRLVPARTLGDARAASA